MIYQNWLCGKTKVMANWDIKRRTIMINAKTDKIYKHISNCKIIDNNKQISLEQESFTGNQFELSCFWKFEMSLQKFIITYAFEAVCNNEINKKNDNKSKRYRKTKKQKSIWFT